MGIERLHQSSGKLKYSYYKDYGYKLVLLVDPGISKFYRSLIPFWKPKYIQKYPPHISIVRKEIPSNLQVWEKYQGKEINFLYSSMIRDDKKYWWLDVFSKELEEVRIELGLPLHSKFITPPLDFIHTFHITIANKKPLEVVCNK